MEHITVCICTFKRPQLLHRLLSELEKQETEGLFTWSVVVVDNDPEESGRGAVSEFAKRSSMQIVYTPEPQRNIALARNRAVANAHGDFVGFVDDDEYPVPNWLCSLFKTCKASSAGGVLGPVEPYFEGPPPRWAVRGRFFERPRHATGYQIGISDARTGNVLLRKEVLDSEIPPFRPEFATGGEDVDFFRRMMEKGYFFLWCDEASVYELVPPSRCSQRYLLRRALLRGRDSLKHRKHRVRSLVKSLVAVPVYAVCLPFLFVAGSHVFLKYLIKSCDHAGKLLALLRLNPVRERDF